MIAVAILYGLMFLVFLWSIYSVIRLRMQFRWDDRNLCRRWCKTCNQQQEQYTRSYNSRDVWWEDVGKSGNINCNCHNFSEYRR